MSDNTEHDAIALANLKLHSHEWKKKLRSFERQAWRADFMAQVNHQPQTKKVVIHTNLYWNADQELYTTIKPSQWHKHFPSDKEGQDINPDPLED